MAKKPATAGAPSQRMLRVAEEVRHALAAVFLRGELHDPDLDSRYITVTEVRSSPDLRHMTCFVAALGRAVDKEELAGLRRLQPFLRTQVARAVRLRFAPELHFQPDTALEYAMKIDAVMRRPEVQQDLPPRPDKPGTVVPEPGLALPQAARGHAPGPDPVPRRPAPDDLDDAADAADDEAAPDGNAA